MPLLPDKSTTFTHYYDPNKTMQLDLSTLTPGARRVLTVPDKNGTIALTGINPDVLLSYAVRATSIPATVLLSAAPAGVYILQVTLRKYTGVGSVSVTSTWNDGSKDENLITNFT
jgi:hypothetical protein